MTCTCKRRHLQMCNNIICVFYHMNKHENNFHKNTSVARDLQKAHAMREAHGTCVAVTHVSTHARTELSERRA